MENTSKRLKFLTTSGILNIIDAVLCIALFLAFYLCIKTGAIAGKIEGLEGLGFAIVLVIFLPFALACYIPIGIHAIYKIIFGVLALVNSSKVKKGGELRFGKGLFTANVILRIIVIIMLAIEIFLTYSIFDAGNNVLLGIIFSAGAVIVLAVQIVTMVFDGKAKRERKEYLATCDEISA